MNHLRGGWADSGGWRILEEYFAAMPTDTAAEYSTSCVSDHFFSECVQNIGIFWLFSKSDQNIRIFSILSPSARSWNRIETLQITFPPQIPLLSSNPLRLTPHKMQNHRMAPVSKKRPKNHLKFVLTTRTFIKSSSFNTISFQRTSAPAAEAGRERSRVTAPASKPSASNPTAPDKWRRWNRFSWPRRKFCQL